MGAITVKATLEMFVTTFLPEVISLQQNQQSILFKLTINDQTIP